MTRFPFAPPPATAAAACVERRPCTRPRRGAPRWATTPATACRRRRRARRRSRPHRRHSRRPRPRRRYQSHRYAATPATSVSRGGANPRMALAPRPRLHVASIPPVSAPSRPPPPPTRHHPPPHGAHMPSATAVAVRVGCGSSTTLCEKARAQRGMRREEGGGARNRVGRPRRKP